MPALPKKPWTVMMYLVAEPSTNELDLDAPARAEVEAIARAAASVSDTVHVACQVDFNKPDGIFRQVMGADGRLDLQKAAGEEESTPGDHEVLRRFLVWARETCPSDRLAVFFWGHSLGPAGMFKASGDGAIVSPRVLSSPELLRSVFTVTAVAGVPVPVVAASPSAAAATAPAHPAELTSILTLPELADTLRAGIGEHQRLDLVIFKDCFMSTLEVAYQLSDVADFQIGSQGLIPVHQMRDDAGAAPAAAVWPYEQLFGALGHPTAAGAEVADIGRTMVRTLGEFYGEPKNRGANADVPCTLVDLRQMPGLLRAVNDFAGAITPLDPATRVKDICSVSVGDAALVDVGRLCEQFTAMPEARALATALASHVVAHASQTGSFRGTSLFYSPPSAGATDLPTIVGRALFPRGYQALRFSADSDWDDFAFETLLT